MLKEIKKVVEQAVLDIYGVNLEAIVSVPEEVFGDVATNVAMQLAGKLNQNPRDIAEKIKTELQKNDLIEACEIAGPGFINLRLKDKALIDLLSKEPEQFLIGKKVLVEYSDPNPFKPLHAGHLYTTLVGDTISRLIELAGAETIRLNYGGDVGLHVAKTMWSIIKYFNGESTVKLSEIRSQEMPGWLGERYAEGNFAYENDLQAKTEIVEINKRVYKLHAQKDDNSDFAQTYWRCRSESYDYFEKLYKELQVQPFDRFIAESEVTELGLKTVQEQLENGVYELSDGAVIFDGEKHGLHKRVFISSEGLPTYEAKDVGLSLTKWQDYNFDDSIIITANEQSQYMQVVIKSIEQFAPEPAERTKHLTHGVVKLVGGVKMSSRSGNIVSAIDILESARKAGKETGSAVNEDVVLASVKYAFLKGRLGSDIIYDLAESVVMEGNSGPYLQYAHARARSILTKSQKTVKTEIKDEKLEPGERSLVRKLAQYKGEVSKATYELAPHHVCTCLYELAQEFNRFYENNKVIGSDRESQRLYLINCYAETLRKGLSILGIHAPDKM